MSDGAKGGDAQGNWMFEPVGQPGYQAGIGRVEQSSLPQSSQAPGKTAAAGARSLECILVLAMRRWHEEGGFTLPAIHARLVKTAAEYQAHGAERRAAPWCVLGVACAMAAQAVRERGIA
ncbi:unnamed protein product [Prorocentrum cordatum]|uniref:Uncharacterized protein n=1 Tax=Prorocentrum cordatum TaxID=2364126 RepID=A0ABN9W9V4_9DINO|nr:unnamed protein product [Polarella glacialis]